MNITRAVVVEDYRRHKFKTWREILKKAQGPPGWWNGANHVKRALPNTDVELLETYREFFTGQSKRGWRTRHQRRSGFSLDHHLSFLFSRRAPTSYKSACWFGHVAG